METYIYIIRSAYYNLKLKLHSLINGYNNYKLKQLIKLIIRKFMFITKEIWKRINILKA